MIEVSGITLLAIIMWVFTGLATYAGLAGSYDDDRKFAGAIAIVLGSIAFILTLVGSGVMVVI